MAALAKHSHVRSLMGAAVASIFSISLILLASGLATPRAAYAQGDAVDVSDMYFVPSGSVSVPSDQSGSGGVVDTRTVVLPPAPPRQAAPPPASSVAPAAGSGGGQSAASAPRAPSGDRVVSAPRQSADVVDRLAPQRFSSAQMEAVKKWADQVASGVVTNSGRGAPNADQFFDQTLKGTGVDDVSRGAGTRVIANGSYNNATTQDAQTTVKEMGSIPGGVVLDGAASFGKIERMSYDARFNAFVLNDNTVYFAPVAPKVLAVLCRALQQDNRIGVSLGGAHVVYGKEPPDSELVLDMKIADHFLGSIVFAQDEWLGGYKLAGAYKPLANKSDAGYVAVFFKFTGFQFAAANGELKATNATADIRLYPLSRTAAADGGLAPDLDATAKGLVSPQYKANAEHVAKNIEYYRREPIVDKMFQYGEAAAFLRGLRNSGFDLNAIAKRLESPVS